MLRAAPAITILVLLAPVLFGLSATLLPAFGYLPVLGGTGFSLAPFEQLLALPGLLRSSLLSLFAGLVTTLVSVIVVGGFVASWSHTRVFRSLQHLLSPLLSVPHAAAAFGLAFLLAPSGWLMRVVSPELTGFTRPPDWLIVNDPVGITMMAGLVAKELPFLFLVTLAALPQAAPRGKTAIAASLGYGRIAGFLHTVWPQLYPQIRLAVFAVLAYATSVVDVAIILGPTQPAPLSARLVQMMNDPDLSLRFMASAGAVLQLAITLGALAIWLLLERLGGGALSRLAATGWRFGADQAARLLFAGLVVVSAMAIFAGLFVLALWSVAGNWQFPDALPESLTLRTWERQLSMLGRPVLVTLLVGLLSTLVALVLAVACLEREARTGNTGGNRALLFLYAPLLVPQIAFVFGLQLFFLASGLNAGFVALAMVHLVFVLPYVFLSLSDPWRALDVRYLKVARSLGVAPNHIFWRIKLPILLRPLLAAAAVGFAVSVSLYLPTLLIGAGRWPTLATEAVALSSGGDRRIIGVYAFVQLVLPGLGFALATLVPAILHARRRDMSGAS